MPSSLLIFLACAYDEELAERDIKGRLIVPKEVATRDIKANTDPADFSTTPLTDPRLIGPIFIGAYSAIDSISRPYPIPEQGPIISQQVGNSFPYGGTTVGRYDFACYKFLACKVQTGRFEDYADMLDYFANVLQNPIKDDEGVEITSDDEFRYYCYDYYYANSDTEMSFIGKDHLSFEDKGDHYEAEFTLFHTVYVEGMSVWGFMDAPIIRADQTSQNGTYSTCDLGAGREISRYNQEFQEGASYTDVLNLPSNYLDAYDWVTSGTTVNDPSAEIEITLDIQIISEQ